MRAPLALIQDGAAEDGPVVVLRGEIDVGSTAALRDWLSRASGGGRCSVAVDLDNVGFMAVSGLYVLADEQARMAQHNARLSVICSNPRILQLFDVCRLSDVLHIVPSRTSLAADRWSDEDDRRARALGAWLERYSAGASRPTAS